MLDVFFYEAFAEEEPAIRRYLPPQLQVGFTWKTIQEDDNKNLPASLISIRTQSIVPLSWATQMSGLLTRSTGYDHIHEYWQKCQKSLPSGYLPLYCSRSVAEQALLLWMSLLRKLPQQTEQFYSFNREGLTGQDCQNKTLLVVGVGQIGYEVVQIGKSLKMKVLGVDVETKHADVSYVSIEEGLSQADIVVCAMNLTSENIGYFNYSLLKKGKPGLIFVNIARGELSPAVDLLQLINEQWLGGVALDVYEQESELATLLRNKPATYEERKNLVILKLAKHPNVIMTPHNAFNTQEAVARKSEQTVRQISHFLETGQFLWPVPPRG